MNYEERIRSKIKEKAKRTVSRPTLLRQVFGTLSTVEGAVVMNGSCARVTCSRSRARLAAALAKQCKSKCLI